MIDTLYSDKRLVEAYDALNGAREDFDFYLTQLPPPPATILDIGCGTGAFARDMAQRGYTVTALDPSPAMIAAAQNKDTASQVTWRIGFLSDLPCVSLFDASVMTGHAFQCLLTDHDIKELFYAVGQRLKPGGAFHFETRNPAAQAWRNWSPQKAAPPRNLGNGCTVQVLHQVLEVAAGLVTFEERYHFNDSPDPICSTSTLRFADLHEIKALAAQAHLEITNISGNWQGQTFTQSSPEMIFHLTRPA